MPAAAGKGGKRDHRRRTVSAAIGRSQVVSGGRQGFVGLGTSGGGVAATVLLAGDGGCGGGSGELVEAAARLESASPSLVPPCVGGSCGEVDIQSGVLTAAVLSHTAYAMWRQVAAASRSRPHLQATLAPEATTITARAGVRAASFACSFTAGKPLTVHTTRCDGCNRAPGGLCSGDDEGRCRWWWRRADSARPSSLPRTACCCVCTCRPAREQLAPRHASRTRLTTTVHRPYSWRCLLRVYVQASMF